MSLDLGCVTGRSILDGEDVVMEGGFLSRKAFVVGFVSRTTSVVELERIEEVGEFESVLKTKGGDGKRELEDEDEKGLWEVR